MGYIVLPYISHPQTTSTRLRFYYLKSREVLIGNNLLSITSNQKKVVLNHFFLFPLCGIMIKYKQRCIMEEKRKKIGKRIKSFIKKFLKNAKHYFKHNVLFITYIIVCLINGCLLRFFTVKNYTASSPFLADLAVIIILGSFGYLFKQKNRYKYYMYMPLVQGLASG